MPPFDNTGQIWRREASWDDNETTLTVPSGLGVAFTDGGQGMSGGSGTNLSGMSATLERLAFNRERQMVEREIRNNLGVTKSVKVSKKAQELKELDKISNGNKDLFGAIDKLNKDLSILYFNSVDDLLKKYGQSVAWAIGNPNAIEKISKSKIAKDIPNVMRRYVIGDTFYKVDKKLFADRYLNLMAKFKSSKISEGDIELINELYSLFTKEYEIRQELDKLMCNNKKKSTVCEDYLYSNSRPRLDRIVFSDGFDSADDFI